MIDSSQNRPHELQTTILILILYMLNITRHLIQKSIQKKLYLADLLETSYRRLPIAKLVDIPDECMVMAPIATTLVDDYRK